MNLTIQEAKEKALQLKQVLINNPPKDKEVKKTVKQLLKLIDEFVRCHCSNEAVFTKYAKLKAKLSEIYSD